MVFIENFAVVIEVASLATDVDSSVVLHLLVVVSPVVLHLLVVVSPVVFHLLAVVSPVLLRF